MYAPMTRGLALFNIAGAISLPIMIAIYIKITNNYTPLFMAFLFYNFIIILGMYYENKEEKSEQLEKVKGQWQ